MYQAYYLHIVKNKKKEALTVTLSVCTHSKLIVRIERPISRWSQSRRIFHNAKELRFSKTRIKKGRTSLWDGVGIVAIFLHLKPEPRKGVLVYEMVWALLLFFFISMYVVVEMQMQGGGSGKLEIVKKNCGVFTMHMALLPNHKIIIFNHTDFAPSNISLPSGKSRIDHQTLKEDWQAHSIEHVEYDFDRPFKLEIET